MFKKIFLLFFLFNFLFVTSVSAQTPTPEATSETESSPWYSFFTNLFGLDSSQGTQVKTGASWNYAKEKPEELPDTSENRDYNSQGFDTTTRAIDYKTQKIEKGKYLYHLLNDDDSYENLEYKPTGCNKISLKEMAAVYYQRGEKILYNEDGQQLDWNKDIMDKIEIKYTDPLTNTCYDTVYDQMPMTPQGTFRKNFLDKITDKITGKDTKLAAASSGQINKTIKTIIPASNQTDTVTPDINDPDKTTNVVTDSHTEEGNMLLNLIPASSQNLTNSATDRDNLREDYTLWLHPDSWEEDIPERDENSATDGTVISCDFPEDTSTTASATLGCTLDTSNSSSSSGTCNGKRSHCRGMSQYGAYGMAKSGKSYLDILKFYYGDIALRSIGTNNLIKVKITDSSSGCSGSQIGINLEQYLYGLGEMSDYWGKLGFEALKAQAVAARTYAYVRTKALSQSICNSSKCQVYKCNNLGKKPLFQKAVNATAGQIIVDATNHSIFSTEYARSFCGPSKTVTYKTHTIPSVDGSAYEVIGNNGKAPYCK